MNQAAYPFRGTGNFAAIAKVQRAVKGGLLRPAKDCICVDCGKGATHYEHRDYNKPLDVDPVCDSCNHKRGVAIPRRGFFADAFSSGYIGYTSKKSLQQILAHAGIHADLSEVPKQRVGIRYWMPFKDSLLEWERQE